MPENDPPQARALPRGRTRPSLVWLIPMVAALVAEARKLADSKELVI